MLGLIKYCAPALLKWAEKRTFQPHSRKPGVTDPSLSHKHVSLTHVSLFSSPLSPLRKRGSGRSVSAYSSYLQHHQQQQQQQQQQHVPQGLPPQLHPFQQQQMSAPSNAGNYSSQLYKGLSVQADNFQQVTIPERLGQGVSTISRITRPPSLPYPVVIYRDFVLGLGFTGSSVSSQTWVGFILRPWQFRHLPDSA